MNIGNYVRIKNGIGKIIKCNSMYFILDTDKDNIVHDQDEIIKSSPNIIDLIEENDYVKLDGRSNIKYWRIVKGPTNKLMIEDDGWNELDDLEDEEITGIITYEQMKNMEYKVGD